MLLFNEQKEAKSIACGRGMKGGKKEGGEKEGRAGDGEENVVEEENGWVAMAVYILGLFA